MKMIKSKIYRYLIHEKGLGLWVFHKLLSKQRRKVWYMLLSLSYLGGLLEVKAANISGEAVVEGDVFKVTYRLYRSFQLQESEVKEQEVEERGFLSPRKYHLGVGLVADIYERGSGTIMALSYTLVNGINNQENKPNINGACPPLCKSCYKIMKILYPKLLENKAITWAQDGCKGAMKGVDRKNVGFRLPRIAGYVKTHLSQNEVNKLLKELDLMDMQENTICVHFFTCCYEGNVDKAESYLGKVSAIGLDDPRRASELLYTCITKVGFMKVVKFLVEKEGANINYPCKETSKTPIMRALMAKHKDAWSYFVYMAKQQSVDMTYALKVENEQFSLFDYMFRGVKEKKFKHEYVVEMAEYFLAKNREISDKAYKMCVNELLLSCCITPNFLLLIKRLVEEEGGLINYKDNGKRTAAMRCLEFQHKESLVYFKYFFKQGNIDCGFMFQEDGQYITMFDLLFNYAEKEHEKEVIAMAKALIKNGGSQEMQKMYASMALAGASCFPNLGDLIVFLVEKMGANVHYKLPLLTPSLRALKIKHKDSWKYFIYLYKQGGVDPYFVKKSDMMDITINLFDLVIDYLRPHNMADRYFPFVQDLYNQRKNKDNKNKITLLLSRILLAACPYPGFKDVVKFCVQEGANLNYKRKGVPHTLPTLVLTSPDLMLDKKQNKRYHQDMFTYLRYMLKCPKIQYNYVLKTSDGSSISLLYILASRTKGVHKREFKELIEVLHQSNSLQKKDLGYLKNRKVFTSDNKFVLRRLEEMVGKPKKKHTPNNNKKKSKRKRKNQK